MYSSFYAAARGVIAQQQKLDVTANNLANINNYGYKNKSVSFSNLMYYNMNNQYGQDTAMKAGTGVKVEMTNTDFTPEAYTETDGAYDFAIGGKGFFRLVNPSSDAVTYTRNGHFSLSQQGNQFYLVNDAGNRVCDRNGNPVIVNNGTFSGEIGIYQFNITDGMQSVGDNEFAPTAKNGTPFLVQDGKLIRHALETSGVDMAEEMTKVIESQRAYSYALRMVQTSDEIVNTVNSSRQ